MTTCYWKDKIDHLVVCGKRRYNTENAYGSILWRNAIIVFVALLFAFAVPIHYFGYNQPHQGLCLVQSVVHDTVDVWANVSLARDDKNFFSQDNEYIVQKNCDADVACIEHFVDKYQQGFFYTCQWKKSSNVQSTLTFDQVYARRNQTMRFVSAGLFVFALAAAAVLLGLSYLAFTTSLSTLPSYSSF